MKKVLTIGGAAILAWLLYIWQQYISSDKQWWDVIVPRPWTWYENTWTVVKEWTIDWIPTS